MYEYMSDSSIVAFCYSGVKVQDLIHKDGVFDIMAEAQVRVSDSIFILSCIIGDRYLYRSHSTSKQRTEILYLNKLNPITKCFQL